MVGNAVVVLLFVAWVALPWLRATRESRRRRASARAWGTPLAGPPTGAEDEAVVLRGRLEADQPIAHLRGPATIAATLDGSATSDGHLHAEGLRLRMGDVTIPIEGRVQVVVGATEEHPRSMPEKTEYRFAEAETGAGPKEGKRPKRAQLRRIATGSEVIVRGHLERRAADGGQYREGAHGWALVTGEHGEPIELVAESPARVRFPARDWALRALGIGTLLFLFVPLGLEHGSKRLGSVGNDTLRDCDPSGHSWLEAADWVARAEGAFPGFAEAALKRRASAMSRAVNGVRVCRMDHDVAIDWVEPLVGWAERSLPALTDYRYYDSERNELEATLHEAGLDGAVVALQEKLPRGGDVTERVRAHLYLGDLEGAVATWDEPGARAHLIGDSSLEKGVVLCMAGRHEEAMASFLTRLQEQGDTLVSFRLKEVLFSAGACALRMDDLDRAEQMADAMSELEYPEPHRAELRARLAAARGEAIAPEGEPLRVEVPAGEAPMALLGALQLAEAREWERLVHWLQTSPIGHPLGMTRELGASLYNPIFTPPLPEEQLATLAVRLLEGADAVDREVAEANEAEPSDTPRNPPVSGSMRRWAGQVHRYRAALLGVRWDPRADEALDAAERLLGPDELQPLREALAFFHGDWERTKESSDRDIRNLSRIYLGEPREEGFWLDLGSHRDVGLTMLNPSDLRAEQEIGSLYLDSHLSDEQRWSAIRDQKQSARWPVIFYRLTHVITHGENLGMDVSAHREQFARLRALVNEQPEPYLFMGPEGDGEL